MEKTTKNVLALSFFTALGMLALLFCLGLLVFKAFFAVPTFFEVQELKRYSQAESAFGCENAVRILQGVRSNPDAPDHIRILADTHFANQCQGAAIGRSEMRRMMGAPMAPGPVMKQNGTAGQ